MQSVLDRRGKALAAAIHADTLSVILKSNQIMTVIHATSVSSTNRARVSSEQSDAQQNGGYAIVRPSVSPGRHAGVCRLLQYRRCGWQGQALQGEWRGGGLGRSEIDCLDGVHEVGNRLLLNECVGKVFSSYSGGVYSLNITGQNYPIMEVVPPTPTNISLFFYSFGLSLDLDL